MTGRRTSSADGRRVAAAAAVAVAALCFASGGGAQEIPQPPAEVPRAGSSDGWNSEAALLLSERAIDARRNAWADSSLERFRADVQGHVYYLGDILGERHVIRADQLALDVRWQRPDRSMQTIVGRRHELRLPTTIHYHLDHLFLVLDNFGDRIRIGHGPGHEIRDVLHPAAAGAREFYEYRLADSLEIRIRDRTAQVFELQVRPRDGADAGAVGSLFVERETGAIARMRLTFTPAAYRDPQIVRLVVDLRSALQEGRYWLPDEQEIEIARSLPWFDFPLETLVRTRLRVLDYDFDEEALFGLGPGALIYSLREEELARFDAWEDPLFGGPLEEGSADGDLGAAVAEARELVLRRTLLGGRRWQLALPNASGAIRARRSEGLFVGAGVAYRPNDLTRVSFGGGHAVGEARPQASLGVRRRLWEVDLEVDGWLRVHRDAGPPAGAGVLRTLALLADGEDYEDPYLSTGGRIGIARREGPVRWRVGASFERHRNAGLVVGTAPFGGRPARPVRPVDEGELARLDAGLTVELRSGPGARWTLELAGEAGASGIGDFGYTRGTVALWARGNPGGAWHWASGIEFGAAGGTLPAQRLFLLGGRGSLPGYEFRGWGGDRTALWRAEVSRAVASPWVRLRAIGAIGGTGLDRAGEAAARRFGVSGSAGLRASAGLGLGLFYDILHLDVMRGENWVVLLSVDPRFLRIL
ncbi:hypothetical protein [Candidatus Palauibacter irciniicola]|uniref:hypothetical protein n=1 Tax=Candidatus Palauibacter irciniicola TaxID=3056733 RepID=UPI003B01D04C